MRAVLLDALGTLVELEPPAPLLRAELARRFGVEVDEDACVRAIGAEITYYRAHLDEGRDAESLADLRRRCAQILRDALPGQLKTRLDDLGTLTEALLASLRFLPYRDAAPTLNALKRRGVRLVVVSNWDVSLPSVLERLSLAASLDGIVTSAEAGARKPAAEIFELALRMAATGPADAIHVGDSPEEDVAGARNAGIEPVLLCRDGLARREEEWQGSGVRTIPSLTELVEGYGFGNG